MLNWNLISQISYEAVYRNFEKALILGCLVEKVYWQHLSVMIFLQDIDKYIENAKENGYVALLRVGRQGLNVATDTFLKTAVTVSVIFLSDKLDQ